MASTQARPTSLSFSSKRRRRRNPRWFDRLRALAGLTTKTGRDVGYDLPEPISFNFPDRHLGLFS